MKKVLLIGATALLLAGASYWLSTQSGPYTLETATQEQTLTVGTNVGYPPFIYTDTNGRVIGFDVDVAMAIAKKLNRTLIIKDIAFDALLLALTHGSVDMIIGGISITKERKATGLLIPYYGTKVDRVACFYQADSTMKNLSLSDAAAQKRSICTQAGSLFEEIINQHPGITIKTLPDISDIFLEVSQGHSDMGMLDTDSVRALVRKHPELASHQIILPADQVVEGFGLGVVPTHKEAAAIKEAIKELTADGTIAELARLWFNLED